MLEGTLRAFISERRDCPSVEVALTAWTHTWKVPFAARTHVKCQKGGRRVEDRSVCLRKVVRPDWEVLLSIPEGEAPSPLRPLGQVTIRWLLPVQWKRDLVVYPTAICWWPIQCTYSIMLTVGFLLLDTVWTKIWYL